MPSDGPRGQRPELLLPLTVGVTLFFAVAFGVAGRYSTSLGFLGALAAPLTAAFLLLGVLPMSRARAVAHGALALVLGVVSSVLVALLPLVLVVWQKDASAGLGRALGVGWAFYQLSLKRPGSSLILTAVGLLTTVVGAAAIFVDAGKKGRIGN